MLFFENTFYYVFPLIERSCWLLEWSIKGSCWLLEWSVKGSCSLSCSVVTALSFPEKILKELLSPQAEREAGVTEFISDIKPGISINCVCINDMYGPTIYRGELQCLMLSTETAKGGQAVNSERVKRVRRMSLFVVLILFIFLIKREPFANSLDI